MSLWDFARAAASLIDAQPYDLTASLAVADNASLLGTSLLRYRAGDDIALTPGAGLIVDSDRRLRICVLADAGRTGFEPGVVIPILQVPEVYERVVASLPESSGAGGAPVWSKSIVVFMVTQPDHQLAPGDHITGPTLGTVGVQLTWHSGTGFATAGHVAPSIDASVLDHSGLIGTVAWTNNPAGHGTAIEPDFAVIELVLGRSFISSIANAVRAGPFAKVTVLSSSVPGVIMGLTGFLAMPTYGGTCGDTYFTTTQITTPGDSGGPVLLGTDIIGHVVGASPGTTSYVQDIFYQIREASNPLRLGLPGLRT